MRPLYTIHMQTEVAAVSIATALLVFISLLFALLLVFLEKRGLPRAFEDVLRTCLLS